MCIRVAWFKVGRLASSCEQSNESPVSVKGLLWKCFVDERLGHIEYRPAVLRFPVLHQVRIRLLPLIKLGNP